MHPSSYEYVRVALGMVVGLGIATVLNGLARFMQHPTRHRVDAAHLGWAVYMLVSLIGFWWWEQGLVAVKWDFFRYIFVMTYAVLLFVMSALLFPQDIAEYDGYLAYFLSRRKWFFAMMILTVFVDLADTRLKGTAHFASLGAEYPAKSAAFVLLAGVAMATANPRFHLTWAVLALAYQVFWISRLYTFSV